MIPGHPANTTYRTIALEDFGVFMCGSQDGCPKNMGWRAHWYGRPDRAGTIHWKQADARATRRGMRNFMKLMALNVHHEWWTEPVWMRLYLTNVWTYKEVKDRYHYRIRAAWSYTDKRVAQRLAIRAKPRVGSFRWRHRDFYVWLMSAGLSPDRRVQSKEQEGVQPQA